MVRGVAAVTVKVAMADMPLNVALMTVAPAERPMARPLEFTVATEVSLDVQVAVVVIS
jgi:hypothetical protein